MPSNKEKGSKKKRKSSAKGKQTAAADRGGTELSSKQHTDEELFGSGHESYLGECSICMLRIPLNYTQHSFTTCCLIRICIGCDWLSQLANINAGREFACAFCRKPTPDRSPSGYEKVMTQVQERVDAGDADARFMLGQCHFNGHLGLPKNVPKGIELWKDAARLGSIEAHCNLACCYENGDGVKRDIDQFVYHCEVAAIGGDHDSRYSLGSVEHEDGRKDRALKHWTIAAQMGHENSLKRILELYRTGCAAKDDYAQALLRYQNAIEEMRSNERDNAKEFKAGRGVR